MTATSLRRLQRLIDWRERRAETTWARFQAAQVDRVRRHHAFRQHDAAMSAVALARAVLERGLAAELPSRSIKIAVRPRRRRAS